MTTTKTWAIRVNGKRQAWTVTEVIRQKGSVYLNLVRKGKVKTVKVV
jgi:hypothetical protein